MCLPDAEEILFFQCKFLNNAEPVKQSPTRSSLFPQVCSFNWAYFLGEKKMFVTFVNDFIIWIKFFQGAKT